MAVASTIKNKRSSVPGKIPTTSTLDFGEFGINTYDGKVYITASNAIAGVGTTVIAVNPWSVGIGSTAYDTYFTAGNVGIGTTNPSEPGLTVLNRVQILQLSDSTSRLIFRAKPGNAYRWNIDNDSTNIFRIFSEDDATSANGVVRLSISTTGTVTASKFSGDGSLLTGIVASGSGIVVQNQGSTVGTANTLNFSTNLSASFSSGTATISLPNNISISGILTADQFYTSNNGNGTNIRIGDDLWIGDINVANTTRFSGAQNSDRAFIVFGDSDSVALGRTGTGPLYYGGNLTVSGVVTASSFSGNATSATYATNAGVATYSNTTGIATYATSTGIATYATNAGFSTSSGYATTAGIATVAQGLTGTPNITVGFVTATSFSGNLVGIASTATTVRASGTNANNDYIVPFLNATSPSGASPYYELIVDINSSFTYNPSTKTLIAPEFSGTLTGTASSATYATYATSAGIATTATTTLATTSSTNAAYKVPFLNTTTNATGNYGLLHDSGASFTYNPSSDTLSATTFNGTLTGTASSATILQTSRTFSLTGDVTNASLSFNGSSNVSFAVTVTDDSHNHSTTTLTDVSGGTFTPTLILSGLSTASVGGNDFLYTRVGTTVTVAGKVSLTATTANVGFALTMSLPIARSSNFGGIGGAAGVGVDNTGAVNGRVQSTTGTQNTVFLGISTIGGVSRVVGLSYSYTL